MTNNHRRRLKPVTAAFLVTTGLSLGVGCTGTTTKAPVHAEKLRIDQDVALPGTTSRFDYQSLDPAGHTLWIAHLGDSTVIAVDTKSLKVTSRITSIGQVHGVLAVPDRTVVYATATATNEIAAIDTTTRQVTKRAATGPFPDGLAFDPDDNLLLVSNKTAGTISVHDAQTLDLVRTIKLGGETGNVAYDPANRHGYAAKLPPDALVEFDPVTGAIIKTVSLPGCDGAHGVMINPTLRYAYVACENNARLAIIDLTANTQTATIAAGDDPTFWPSTPHVIGSTSPPNPETSTCSTSPADRQSRSAANTSTTTPTASPSTPKPTSSTFRSPTSTATRFCVSPTDRPRLPGSGDQPGRHCEFRAPKFGEADRHRPVL